VFEDILKPILFLLELFCLVYVAQVRRFHYLLQILQGLFEARMKDFLEEFLYLRKFVAFSRDIPIFAPRVHDLQLSLIPRVWVFLLSQLLFFIEKYIILLIVVNIDASLLFLKLEGIKFEYLF